MGLWSYDPLVNLGDVAVGALSYRVATFSDKYDKCNDQAKEENGGQSSRNASGVNISLRDIPGCDKA